MPITPESNKDILLCQTQDKLKQIKRENELLRTKNTFLQEKVSKYETLLRELNQLKARLTSAMNAVIYNA